MRSVFQAPSSELATYSRGSRSSVLTNLSQKAKKPESQAIIRSHI